MSNRNELVRRLLAVITMSERQNLVNIGEEARPIPVPRRRGEKHALFWGARGGAVVRALASHQCGPVSNPGVDSIEPLCGSATSTSLFTYLFIPGPRRRTPILTPRRNIRQFIQYFEDNPIPTI